MLEINYFIMKFSSNTIITIIIAFLVGIFVASAFNNHDTPKDVDNDTIVEEITEETIPTTTPEPDTSTTPTPTPSISTPTTTYSGTCTPNISGRKDSKLNAIVISWTPCESNNFQFYKILKSSKNSNLSYPADPVVVSSSNKSLNNHVDKTVTRATTYYYRACVVQRLGKVNCGNITSITY